MTKDSAPDRSAPGTGPARPALSGRVLAVLLLLLLSASAASGGTGILEGLKATLASRWEFEKRHPLAAKAFAKDLAPAERDALESGLAKVPAAPPDPAGRVSLPDLWRELALGLCAENRQPGSGEGWLDAAAARARGNVPVNHEVARVLQAAGMYLRAAEHQKETQRALLELGYARVPELAKMELFRAREAMREGRLQAARHSLDFAGRLDPFTPWVPFLAAEMAARGAPWNWDLGEVVARLGDAAALLRHYDNLTLLILNLSRILRLGLGIFGGVCVVVLCARHFFRVAHPFAERLPHAVEMRVRYLALAMVPVSLAVGGFGYAALGLLAAALLWRHCAPEERALLKAVMTGLAVLPLLLHWERSMGRHLDPEEGLHLYHLAYERGVEAELGNRVNAFRSRDPEDSLYRALAGSILFKKQGNLLRAAEGAEDALRMQPGSVPAALHAGNVHLLGFEFAKAAARYASAREAEPERVEAWFNASQAELYANNSGKHKQFLDRAAEIDAQRVTTFLQTNDALFPEVPPNRKAMDPMPGAGPAFAAAWQGALDFAFLDVTIRAGILEVEALWLVLAVVLTALGLWLRFRNFSQASHARDLFECKICGAIMCRTCRKGVHCQACFKAVAGLHDNRLKGEMVASLRVRARAAEARAGRLLGLAFPGAGRLLLGSGMGRLAWPLAASLAYGLLLGMRDLVMEYPAFATGSLAWLAALPLLAVYAAHTLVFLPTRRIRGNGVAPMAAREAVA